MYPAGSWSDPVIVASSGDETDTADESQLDNLSPQPPPDYERGHQALEYMPKSPVYPLLQMTAQKNQVSLTMTMPETR